MLLPILTLLSAVTIPTSYAATTSPTVPPAVVLKTAQEQQKNIIHSSARKAEPKDEKQESSKDASLTNEEKEEIRKLVHLGLHELLVNMELLKPGEKLADKTQAELDAFKVSKKNKGKMGTPQDLHQMLILTKLALKSPGELDREIDQEEAKSLAQLFNDESLVHGLVGAYIWLTLQASSEAGDNTAQDKDSSMSLKELEAVLEEHAYQYAFEIKKAWMKHHPNLTKSPVPFLVGKWGGAAIAAYAGHAWVARTFPKDEFLTALEAQRIVALRFSYLICEAAARTYQLSKYTTVTTVPVEPVKPVKEKTA